MSENTIINEYKKWILSFHSDEIHISENEKGNIECEADGRVGYVNFYEMDIVELRVETVRGGETEFFLHFQINNLERAKEMFSDMLSTMKEKKGNENARVLLSCSCGLTTSYFAELLNDAAKSMSLKYEFNAVPFDHLLEEGKGKDVILLAPQVHYQRPKIQNTFPATSVINIPGDIFGHYDTGKMIEIVTGELKEAHKKHTTKTQRTLRFFETNKKILTIGYVNGGEGKNSSIIYSYYKNGDPCESGEISKEFVSVENLSEIIDPIIEKHPEIDIIALALPGSIENGVVHLPRHPIHKMNVEEILSEKYHKDVFAFNDANMIVTGIYRLVDPFKSLLFYYLPNEISEAGCGIVVNGHMIKGQMHIAGEVKYTQKVLNLSDTPQQLAKTKEGSTELCTKTLVSLISAIGPEAIFLSTHFIFDPEEIKKQIAQYIPEEFLPKFIILADIREYMMVGTFLRSIWRMNDQKRAKLGMRYNPYISGRERSI